jgi:hypothetical protein
MFKWRKEMDRLDIPAANVRQLHRSLSDIQVAFPGLPSQQATAYLCLFAAEEGFGVAIVFHLHASHRLAFYFHDQKKIREQDVDRILDEGIHFAESMGFMLGDLDFQLQGSEEQAALWDSLPLKRGVAEDAAPAKTEEAGLQTELTDASVIIEEAEEMEMAEEIGELEKDLGVREAAVLRKRKPSTEEVEERRQALVENLGRFLASF